MKSIIARKSRVVERIALTSKTASEKTFPRCDAFTSRLNPPLDTARLWSTLAKMQMLSIVTTMAK